VHIPVKLSAKWLTALAALVLLVVAIVGFSSMKTSTSLVIPAELSAITNGSGQVTANVTAAVDKDIGAPAAPVAKVLGLWQVDAMTAFTRTAIVSLALVGIVAAFVGFFATRFELDVGRMIARIAASVTRILQMSWLGTSSPWRTRKDNGAHAPITGVRGLIPFVDVSKAKRRGVVASPNRSVLAVATWFQRHAATAHPAPA